ncbi:MAG: AAA family ATPase, partial [Succinivibrio sp.]|nr:AAA family ATPase [Succinivibrio sp.]
MTAKMLQLPYGKCDFKTIVKQNYYFVDKTRYLKSVFQDDPSQVLLFTRPRRFGKTLTMNMFEAFLSLNYDDPNDLSEHIELFKDKEIYKDKEFCEKFMGKFPVILISFKGAYADTYTDAYKRIAQLMYDTAFKYRFLLDSSRLTTLEKDEYRELLDKKTLSKLSSLATLSSSLNKLAKLLFRHFNQKVILLIDEYDVPLAKAASNKYYGKIRTLISLLFVDALKDSDKYVQKAVVTGCLRVAKESIFTGVNNFRVNTVFNSEDLIPTIIGFTEKETNDMLDYYNLSEFKALVKENYDGYNFNNHEVYCSWDVVNFCQSALEKIESKVTADCYWYHTGSTDVIKEFLGFISEDDADSMQTLVDGGSIKKNIHVNMNHEDLKDHDSDDFWSLLAYTGYLTPAKGAIFDIDNEPIDLVIPNISILKAFRKNILEYFTKDKAQLAKANDIIKAIFDGKALDLSNALEDALAQYISVRDFSSNEPKESYYQGFLNGFFSSQKDMLKGYASNAELGNGYADITFKNKRKDLAVIIEIKHANDEFQNQAKATEALEQIEKNKYVLNYLNDGYVTKIFCYGICFNKKSCYVAFKE